MTMVLLAGAMTWLDVAKILLLLLIVGWFLFMLLWD